jgi:aspartyl-tRNA(Asn)/glutamyl-tRNA(Gln) amidotransferase subunit C
MIDREQVRHVAHLGRLQLTEAEEISFTKQEDFFRVPQIMG